MKKSVEVVKLPIISIADGLEKGRVRSLVVHPEKGAIEFVTIEHEDWQISMKVIPFENVIGIGEYALTIESESSMLELNQLPNANDLLNKKVSIIGSRVMTRKGQLLGEIHEYSIDEDTGKLSGIELTINQEEVVLPASSVITYGQTMIIVHEDALSQPSTPGNALEEVAAMREIASSIPTQEEEELDDIHKKQLELLLGKKVTKDIINKNGDVIIESGSVLTENEILKAQQEGPSVVVDITMNVEE